MKPYGKNIIDRKVNMANFPDIDEFQELLEEIVEEVPEEFFNKLSGGIILLPELKMHPDSTDDNKLYVMGAYAKGMAGRHIIIYYGSFRENYRWESPEEIYNKLKDTLLHEFTHHLESLAGVRDLEIKDKVEIDDFNKRKR